MRTDFNSFKTVIFCSRFLKESTWQCTPVIINSVSVSQLLYQTDPHTLFGMSLPLVLAVIRHFHIAHDASFLPPPPPSPPPKKKERKKKTICIRITFNFTWVFTTFTKTIMHLVYPSNFALPLSSISLGHEGNTREKLKTIVIYYAFIYLCIFLGGGGWGREYKQGALWSMCKWRIIAKTILMHVFGGGGEGKTRTYYECAKWKWRIDLVIVPRIIVCWFLFLLFCFVFFSSHTLKFRNQFNKHKFQITLRSCVTLYRAKVPGLRKKVKKQNSGTFSNGWKIYWQERWI